jgi:hypothetical protein
VFGLGAQKQEGGAARPVRRPEPVDVGKKAEAPPPTPTYTVIRNGAIQKQKSPTEEGKDGSNP